MFRFLSILLFAIGASATQNDEAKCCCTTYDVSVCLSTVNQKVDAEHDVIYQKALSASHRFGDKAVTYLVDAEKQWSTYKNAECEAEYALWDGGTGGPNARAVCIIRLTRLRTDELRRRYHVR